MAITPSNRTDLIAALTSGGLGFASSLLNQNAQGKLSAADRLARRQELMAGMYSDMNDDAYRRAQSGLNATQMDPIAQQRALFSGGVLDDLAGHGATRVGTSGVLNPFSPSAGTRAFMSPEARTAGAADFYKSVGQVNPEGSIPNLTARGFGGANTAEQQIGMEQSIGDAALRYDELNKARRQALLDSIQQPQQQESHKSSIWKKILGGAALAGASFIPGLQAAAPWAASALFGAGLGAAAGGVQGAITGGAGGAISGFAPGGDYFNRRPVGPVVTDINFRR